jgi:hypothetical protein
MDHVSARDARRQGAHSRRWRMREQARSQHSVQTPVSDRYQTPEWLERSFVLPLTQPEASDVPSQPVRRHDDDPEPAAEAMVTPGLDAAAPEPETVPPATSPAAFVRPPSQDIDFAGVIRRSDLSRTMTRLHWVATGLAGLALVAFLLTGVTVVLAVVALFAVAAVAAFGVRVWLSRAPVPRLQR